MANIISRLGVLLGLDSAEFVKGLDAASKKLDQFEQKVNAASRIAGAAFVALGIKAISLADEIADVAAANDVAVGSILKLSDALMQSGGSADDASKVMASFSNFMDKAASGSFEAQQTLAKLGVSLKDIATLDSQSLFEKTVQGLAGIEDPITRNAKAAEILGKAFKGIDLKGFNDLMGQTNEKADEQGRAIQAASDAFGKLEKSARDTQILMAQSLGPTLLETLDYMQKLEAQGSGIGTVLVMAFQAVAVIASDVGFTIKTIFKDTEAVFKAFKAGFSGDFAGAGKIMAEAVTRAANDRAALDAFQGRILSIGSATNMPGQAGFVGPPLPKGGGRATTPGVDTKGDAERKEMQRRLQEIEIQRIKNITDAELAGANEINRIHIEAAEKLAIAKAKIDADNVTNQNKYAKQNAELLAQQTIEIEAEKQAKLRSLRAKYEQQMRQDAEDMQAEADASWATQQNQWDQNLKFFAETQAQEERALGFDKKRLAIKDSMRYATEQEYRLAMSRIDSEERIARIMADTSLEERRKAGLVNKEKELQGMRESLISTESIIDRVGQSWDSVFDNMSNALDQFVRTGKLSFSDLARSIIQDLIRIEMRAQARAIFGFLRKAILAGSGDPQDEAIASLNRDFLPRANGGVVSSDTPYLVGERGPELFVPRQSGMVVPNNSLGSVGGATNITNYNISAIDVKSFEDRILGSAKAVWAANAYANKGLAVSQGRA